MSKVRVLTPVVAFKDNMENAAALKIDGLLANKIRVGLLDNTKPNTGRLLADGGQLLLSPRLASGPFSLNKKDSHANHSSASATPAVFNRLSEQADFVITGLGN